MATEIKTVTFAPMFRDLKATEIDCRIATINDKGLTLLLYKDARVDEDILDETVGPYNWQREHTFKNERLYCKVSLWDSTKGQWIGKEDVGVESFSEKEKGQASDSFKRACFNWGIGRELYTAPFIYIPVTDKEGNTNFDLSSKNGKPITYTKFMIEKIVIKDKTIKAISIINNKNKRVFIFNELPQEGGNK